MNSIMVYADIESVLHIRRLYSIEVDEKPYGLIYFSPFVFYRSYLNQSSGIILWMCLDKSSAKYMA